MEERHQEVLRKCYEYLITNVTPLTVVDRLYRDNILTADDAERIRQEATTNDKNRLLLYMLPRAGPNAFSSLVTALKETKPDQSFIAEYLLAELNKGMYCSVFWVLNSHTLTHTHTQSFSRNTFIKQQLRRPKPLRVKCH